LENSLTGSKRHYITINNWHRYYEPEQLELIKQEYLYTDHEYDTFGKFLVQRYNFHPRQITKGEFKSLFGSFATLAEKRREFLKTQQNNSLAAGLVNKPLEKNDQKEADNTLDKKTVKQQIELVTQIKDHTIKAKEAKEALMNTLYLVSKKLELKVQKTEFSEIDSFIVQNIRNLKEIIDLLNSIERQGDINKELISDTVKDTVKAIKNEIKNVQSINFLTVRREDLAQFNNATTTVNN